MLHAGVRGRSEREGKEVGRRFGEAVLQEWRLGEPMDEARGQQSAHGGRHDHGGAARMADAVTGAARRAALLGAVVPAVMVGRRQRRFRHFAVVRQRGGGEANPQHRHPGEDDLRNPERASTHEVVKIA